MRRENWLSCHIKNVLCLVCSSPLSNLSAVLLSTFALCTQQNLWELWMTYVSRVHFFAKNNTRLQHCTPSFLTSNLLQFIEKSQVYKCHILLANPQLERKCLISIVTWCPDIFFIL